jgi:2-polyprenyl-3-methyl-5-hydroxy-6-metoxy-1,4-benzoquinol methylase
MIEAFPDLAVTASDVDPVRVAALQAVHDGGVHTLTVRRLDATAMDLRDDAFDVVTMLEVLEHIPDAQRALGEAVGSRAVSSCFPCRPSRTTTRSICTSSTARP